MITRRLSFFWSTAELRVFHVLKDCYVRPLQHLPHAHKDVHTSHNPLYGRDKEMPDIFLTNDKNARESARRKGPLFFCRPSMCGRESLTHS